MGPVTRLADACVALPDRRGTSTRGGLRPDRGLHLLGVVIVGVADPSNSQAANGDSRASCRCEPSSAEAQGGTAPALDMRFGRALWKRSSQGEAYEPGHIVVRRRSVSNPLRGPAPVPAPSRG